MAYICYFKNRFDIIFDLDRSLRLHSFLFGHIFRLYDFSRHLCVGLSYAHHYPVYIHSCLIMSHCWAHYSLAFNTTFIWLVLICAIRRYIVFNMFDLLMWNPSLINNQTLFFIQPIRLRIVEHIYSQFLYTRFYSHNS